MRLFDKYNAIFEDLGGLNPKQAMEEPSKVEAHSSDQHTRAGVPVTEVVPSGSKEESVGDAGRESTGPEDLPTDANGFVIEDELPVAQGRLFK